MVGLTRSILNFGLAAALLVAGPALAMPLTYDETSDGDLNDNVLTFDTGSNKVSGNMFAGTGPFDFDPFDFVIPTGLTLDEIFIDVSNVVLTNGDNIAQSDLEITLEGPGVSDFESFHLFGSLNESVFGSSLPASGGTYDYDPIIFVSPLNPVGSDFFEEINVSMDYTWTFNVSGPQAVPTPSSIALLFLGFAVMLSRLAKRGK